jgi:uncharacterized membrane protein YphA (DoxX/SURF4 family)
MEILGIILIVYGSLILAGLLLQFPFFYNNPKSKAFIKMLGRKGFNILLLVIGLLSLIIGILLIT